MAQGFVALAHSPRLAARSNQLDAKPREDVILRCSKPDRTNRHFRETQQCSIHLSRNGFHIEAATHKSNADSLVTNCTFSMRTTAAAAQGKSIHFQFVAGSYHALKVQKPRHNAQSPCGSRVISVLCS